MPTHNTLSVSINRALKLKNYRPSRKVNGAMSKLVNSVVHTTNAELADTSELQREAIRQVSSMAEYELETYWSRRIVNTRNAKKALTKFPYTRNYALLVERELALLKSTGLSLTAQHRILIVGSGPLPLTYIELFKLTGASVDLLDSSDEAIDMSERFCRSLDLSANHIRAKGETVKLTCQYDAILLAALAGSTKQEKQTIVNNLLQYLSHDGRLIARSASGARTLLYPAIESPFKGLQIIAENHPDDEVINSILIYGKKNEK